MLSTLFAGGTLLKIALALVTLANGILGRQRDKGLKNIGIEAAVKNNSDPDYLERMRNKYSDDR
jgi:hypothetical protein